MFYRGPKPREPKFLRESRVSTLEDKLRRHKNKKRIWRRCVEQIALLNRESTPAKVTS